MSRTAPILEFDPDRRAILEPTELVPRTEIPPRAVVCFFYELLAELVRQGELEVLAARRSEMGEHPIYRFTDPAKPLALFHPGVGGPLAAFLLEEVIAMGCRTFVACGAAGVLDPTIAVGEILVPIRALRDEGTSYHYLPPGRSVDPHPEVVAAIQASLEAHGAPFVPVLTWTTDAIYRETLGKARSRRAEGCLSVEMEAATFFAVARHRAVRFGQLLYAGDNVGDEAGVWDDRQWQDQVAVRRRIFEIAVDAALRLDTS